MATVPGPRGQSSRLLLVAGMLFPAALAVLAGGCRTPGVPRIEPPALSARQIAPREVLCLPWGTEPGQVSFRALPNEGWLGPSTFAVHSDTVYVVDRLNQSVKVFDSAGLLVQTIPLPEEFSNHPYELEVAGQALYLAYYGLNVQPSLARYRSGQWTPVNLADPIPGFEGWLHLSLTTAGDVAVRRDSDSGSGNESAPHWALLTEAGVLLETTSGLLMSPDPDELWPALGGPDFKAPIPDLASVNLILVDHRGKVIAYSPLSGGTPTNVVTLERDPSGLSFVRSYPLTGEVDRCISYLTVFGPNLEPKGKWALSIPASYRPDIMGPSSDVGRTEVAANGRYYQMLYLTDRLVVLEWDPLGTP